MTSLLGGHPKPPRGRASPHPKAHRIHPLDASSGRRRIGSAASEPHRQSDVTRRPTFVIAFFETELRRACAPPAPRPSHPLVTKVLALPSPTPTSPRPTQPPPFPVGNACVEEKGENPSSSTSGSPIAFRVIRMSTPNSAFRLTPSASGQRLVTRSLMDFVSRCTGISKPHQNFGRAPSQREGTALAFWLIGLSILDTTQKPFPLP